MVIQISPARKPQLNASLEIAKDLKEWFTKQAIRNMATDFKINKLAVALDKTNVVGFLCYSSTEGVIKINWLGVKREYQRKGIGTKLLKFLFKEAKKMRVSAIEVETLTDQDDYEPYKLTRAFYQKHGFKKSYIRKARHPGWDDQQVMERSIS